ncbi:unnamed protein product, partial [Allacma fusca]
LSAEIHRAVSRAYKFLVIKWNTVLLINMKHFWTHILLFAILVNFSTSTNGNSSTRQRTTWFPPENSREDEEPQECFANTFEDNSQNGVYQLIEFIITTNFTLTKLRAKLDDLESKNKVLNTTLLKTTVETKTISDSLKQEIASLKEVLSSVRTSHSQQIKNLESQIENLKRERNAEVNEMLPSLPLKLDGLERTQNAIQSSISSQAATISKLQSSTSKMTSVLFKRNPEDFVDFLPLRNEKSFNGSVSVTVPTEKDLVVQIKNYMDVDLTGYQLHLPYGFVVAPAPNNISAKAVEVATFMGNTITNSAAQPEMSYRIGSTDISLHVYFVRGRNVQTFAAALLPKSAPAKSIISSNCTKYKHSGSVGSHKCVTEVGADRVKTVTVYEGDIFLNVTSDEYIGCGDILVLPGSSMKLYSSMIIILIMICIRT